MSDLNNSPAVDPSAQGTATQVVGCKQPNGLLLELGQRGSEEYKHVTLRGSNHESAVGGYGLTIVSKAFMEAWMKKFGKSSVVQKSVILIADNVDAARKMALNQTGILTGLERLNPRDSKLVDPTTGKPLVTVDEDHFRQGKAAVAEHYGPGARF